MTKEITKAFIIQQIEDKFKLREFDPENFLFSETVVPTYDIGQHLMHRETYMATKSVTGTGGIQVKGVAETQRLTIHSYTVIFMGAGAYTVAGVYVTRANSDVNFVYLDLTAAQTVSYTINLPKDVVLDVGDKLWINIDGYTSTQNIQVIFDTTIEELR